MTFTTLPLLLAGAVATAAAGDPATLSLQGITPSVCDKQTKHDVACCEFATTISSQLVVFPLWSDVTRLLTPPRNGLPLVARRQGHCYFNGRRRRHRTPCCYHHVEQIIGQTMSNADRHGVSRLR